MTFGSSLLPRMNGPGEEEAAYCPVTTVGSMERTARWVFRLPEIVLEEDRAQSIGPTAAVIYGSLRALAVPPPVQQTFSTTCGNSIPRPIDGHGWVEMLSYLPAKVRIT